MAKKPKAHVRHMPTLTPDSVRPPPALPDAEAVLEMDLDLTPDEITAIRMAMAIHSASKKPQLTWNGWKHLAVAISIGSERAQRKAKTTNTKDYEYRMLMGQFLRKTGLIFINKNDRIAAVRLLEIWEDVDAWRSDLTESRRRALNNPRDIEEEYHKDQKALGVPQAKGPRHGGKRRSLPSLLEQVTALEEACAAAEERRDRAEQESEYFAELAHEIATHAKMSDEEFADIRAKVRAKRKPLIEEEPDDGDD
jgi:hypothetical protein